MASSFKSPILQAIDQNGDPVPGAKLFVFASGTTTPVAVFSDEALTVALPNPIIANARGYFSSAGGIVQNIFWDGQPLRLRLTDAQDSVIWEIDNYSAETGAALTSANNTFTGDNTFRDELLVQRRPGLLVEANLNITVPGDFPNWNAAFEYLSRLKPVDNRLCTLTIQSGHQITTGALLRNVDLGWVTIVSEDASVTVIESGLGGPMLDVRDSIGPVIGTLFVFTNGGTPRDGVSLNGSSMRVLSNSGLDGAGRHNFVLRGGRLFNIEREMIARNAGQDNITGFENSMLYTRLADLSGAARNGVIGSTFWAEFTQSDLSGAGLRAIDCGSGCYFRAPGVNCDDSATLPDTPSVRTAVRASSYGKLFISGATVRNSGGAGIANSGAFCNARDVIVTGAATNGLQTHSGGRTIFRNGNARKNPDFDSPDDMLVHGGGWVDARNAKGGSTLGVSDDADKRYNSRNVITGSGGIFDSIQPGAIYDRTNAIAEVDASTTTLNVTSITRSGDVATVTTDENHFLKSGDIIRISGASQSQYNGVRAITVTGDDTFTYRATGSPATPATGTIIAQQLVPSGGIVEIGTFGGSNGYFYAWSCGKLECWRTVTVNLADGASANYALPDSAAHGKQFVVVPGEVFMGISWASTSGDPAARAGTIVEVGSSVNSWTVRNASGVSYTGDRTAILYACGRWKV